ncbi:MAG TPA: dual specificity protein phosphatase [Sphingomicrobium sp.]|nr:dual specificity protein phosphatase [Sphingomicrobium sp.]
MNNSKTPRIINDDEEDHQAVEEDEEEDMDDWSPNFHWITDDLATGGSFPGKRAAELAGAHGISAVVDLRAEECDDDALLNSAGITLLHLPTPDMESVRYDQLEKGVAFVRGVLADGGKVLIHCEHGIGRSALLTLCVLVDQGWQPLDALAHAKARRDLISPCRSQYEGWAAWLSSRGIRPPDYHAFGCIAYRHLANR